MRGETVVVAYPETVGVDDLGAEVREVREVEVGNVLVCPGATSDLSDSARPDGVRVAYTLHFPKAFTGSLRGCKVAVRGEWLNVVGDPKPYALESCPTDWCMPVEVSSTHG